MTLKIYVLTMEGSSRHAFQQEQLKRLSNIPSELVFGGTFSDDFITEHVNRDDEAWHKSQFSGNAGYINRCYSNAEGHLRMLAKFIQSDFEYGLFLEDDMILPDNIEEKLQQTIQWIKGKNVWHLATEAFVKWNSHYQKNQKVQLTDTVKSASTYRISTGAYLCNKNGAKLLFSKNFPVRGPADYMMFNTSKDYHVVYGTGIDVNWDFQIHSLIGQT